MLERFKLSDEKLDYYFDQDEINVRDFVFASYPRSPEALTLVLIGGQPGAGKSHAVAAVTQRHSGKLVPIIGDDLRPFHPLFDEVMSEDVFLMPDATAQASGAWVKRALDYALREKYSVLLEGTFRDPLMVVQTAARFKAAGYRVEAIGLAVADHTSLPATVNRFLDPSQDVARWTPAEAHDLSYRMVPATLQALELSPDVDALAVTNRDAASLYVNVRLEGAWQTPVLSGASVATLQERAIPPTPDQARTWMQAYLDLSRALANKGQMNDTTLSVTKRLSASVQHMATIAYPGNITVRELLNAHERRMTRASAGIPVKIQPVHLPRPTPPSPASPSIRPGASPPTYPPRRPGPDSGLER